MTDDPLKVGVTVAIAKETLNQILANLRREGYQTIGPRSSDQTIVYDEIEHLEDLPRGYLSEQKAGYYRLFQTGHPRYFDITPGAQSWKQYLFPPISEILHLCKNGAHWEVQPFSPETSSFAFIGVRPCELAAVLIQDRIFIRENWEDPLYAARRESLFLLVVNCLHPGDTCFCDSMGTGPEAISGFDLALTELEEVFLVKVGSEKGRAILSGLEYRPATTAEQEEARAGFEQARQYMGRQVPEVESLPALLLSHLDAQRWQEVAQRCLSCTNCTMVCPTCFCWEAHDSSDLSGLKARRERLWDSCFNPDYSYVAGGNSRPSVLGRYRQWLIHKFATWKSQFGTFGCVGCGRCITWCPAGIDITEELAAIREEAKTLPQEQEQ